MTEEQLLYRCVLNIKPLNKHYGRLLSMARRELDIAEDYPSVCKARGKIEVLKSLLALRSKLQKKQ